MIEKAVQLISTERVSYSFNGNAKDRPRVSKDGRGAGEDVSSGDGDTDSLIFSLG